MKQHIGLLIFCFLPLLLPAQFTPQASAPQVETFVPVIGIPKLYQRNHGVILGIQRGKSFAIELGGEAHWRKISFRKPHIIGATANMEYNFGDHIIGYKAGAWMKRGRINLTYGANLVYFNNFEGLNRYGINPAIGFRFAGFHLINGFNILGGDKEMEGVNTLYMSLRYYFPLQNKFIWDKKDKERARAKKEREREREREKREREKEREREKKDEERKGIKGLLDRLKKKER
jgi:hypothetical protein